MFLKMFSATNIKDKVEGARVYVNIIVDNGENLCYNRFWKLTGKHLSVAYSSHLCEAFALCLGVGQLIREGERSRRDNWTTSDLRGLPFCLTVFTRV